jgi:predicted nucleotidyltransferase
VLFGSLAVGGTHARSDVDLAVSGLERDQFFSALGDLMDVFEAPVDLVELESAPGSLRERIEAEGEPL